MHAARLITLLIRPQGLFLLGAALLALHPLMWLVGTWREPAYNSQGIWVALAVLALGAWSYTSEQLPDSEASQRRAYALLALSALVRMAGQVLRINVLGALTLSLDVYALASLAGLHQRKRAVQPFWLALLFAFSLPLERVVQRIIGYGLQQISATGACGMLNLVTTVQCMGQRILIAGQDVLVDLPCSGTRSLTLVLMLYVALAALKRPSLMRALNGLLIAIAGALAANMLRITLLALGLAYAPSLQLMQAPAHELLGLLTLSLASVPVLLWAKTLPKLRARDITPALLSACQLNDSAARTRRRAWRSALAFLALCIAAVSLPARPLDVARAVAPPQLPPAIDGHHALPQPLSKLEQDYFTRYGGGAARASYGPFALLLVSTAAPLRHLHAPDECLRGSGHAVRYMGLSHGRLPTAIYRSTDPQGQNWRVRVSYISSRGQSAASIAQAVWLWLQDPAATWTLIQRIAPWDLPADETERWDASVLRALDLAVSESPTIFSTPGI